MFWERFSQGKRDLKGLIGKRRKKERSNKNSPRLWRVKITSQKSNTGDDPLMTLKKILKSSLGPSNCFFCFNQKIFESKEFQFLGKLWPNI